MPPPSSTLSSIITNLDQLYRNYVVPQLPAPLQTISSYVEPLLTSTLTSFTKSPDIVSIAALLVTLYMTFRIADYLRRSIFGWIFFGIKLLLVLVLVQVVLYVNQYGWEKTLRDAGWLGGIVWGFVEAAFQEQDDGTKTSGHRTAKAREAWSAYAAGGRQQVPVGSRNKAKRGGWN